MTCVQDRSPGTRVTNWARRMRTRLGLWVAGAKFKAGQPGRPRCSFCGVVYDAVDTIVGVHAGLLDVWICRRCVSRCEMVLDGMSWGDSGKAFLLHEMPWVV